MVIIMHNFTYFETDGEFSLYLYSPAWRTQKCKKGLFYNKKTGEKTYFEAIDRWIFFDENGNLLSQPIKSEDWEWQYG